MTLRNAGFAPGEAYHCKRIMGLLFAFLLGVGNFALHKAVLESGHPLVGQMPWFYHQLGGRVSLGVEYLMLLAALLLAAGGAGWAVIAYLAYSGLNSLSAWLILTRRV